ncbi:MAG: hypothetical protein P4K93_16625 [Terracidiphilus sp.]|nr:hypothetical protein [Terracidiphilus sp.]MDR3799777.1 hypothetical protein [Terracidiphilus sp.]
MNRLEELRKSFGPGLVTTLFVGESAPDSGRFFYSSDSSLFYAMKRAFGSKETFLEDFKRKGFYLDDLVLTPINKLERRERSRRREEAVPELAKRLVEYKPKAVVVVMRAILPMVRQAMRMAGIWYEPFCVPHPAFGNWTRFNDAMTAIIDDLPVADGSKQKD